LKKIKHFFDKYADKIAECVTLITFIIFIGIDSFKEIPNISPITLFFGILYLSYCISNK